MTAVGNWGGCDRHKKAKESLAKSRFAGAKQVICDMKKPLRTFENVRRFKGPKHLKTGESPLRILVGAPRRSIKKL